MYFWKIADGRIWSAAAAAFVFGVEHDIVPLYNNGEPSDIEYLRETILFYGFDLGELKTLEATCSEKPSEIISVAKVLSAPANTGSSQDEIGSQQQLEAEANVSPGTHKASALLESDPAASAPAVPTRRRGLLTPLFRLLGKR